MSPLIFLATDGALSKGIVSAFSPLPALAFTSPPDALNHLLRHTDCRLPVIDLDTTPDIEHLINFIKSSPLRRVGLVSIGSAASHGALAPEILNWVAATLRTPQSPADLAKVTGPLRALLANPG